MRSHRVLLLALATVAAVQYLAGGAPAVAATPSRAGGEDLYLLQARGGVLSGDKLVLHGVAPEVTSFTDRPRRSAGSVPAAAFASGWKSTFGSVPPNAALEVQGAPKSRDVAVLELSHPRYRAASHTLTYSVRRLDKTGDPALKEFDRRADGRAVKRFGPASLFVDAGGAEPTGAIVEIFVPAGETLTLKFEGGTSYADGVYIAGINTPTTNTYSVSNGEIQLAGSSMVFRASNGGGGMRAQVFAFVTESSAETIAGEATIPASGQASIGLQGQKSQELANGKFSLPVH